MLRHLIPSCLILALAASGCRARIDNDDRRDDSEGQEPKTETPVEEPAAEPAQKAAPIDPGTLTFLETNIDLVGDFRVSKVERDTNGNYYVAFVTATPAYALIKFDGTGKELWRFPTLENSTVGTDTPDKVGSYLLGRLSDMHVSPAGDVWLLGLRDQGVDVKGMDGRLANFASVTWKATQSVGPVDYLFANVVFMTRILGAGNTADAPKIAFETKLAAPVWWTPLAIRAGDDGSITLESSSGGVQQVQTVDPTFSKVSASSCFVTETPHVSSGSDRLLSVAFAAPQPVVDAMIAPLPATFSSDLAAAADFKKAALESLAAGSGRCWDLIGTRVMPEGIDSFRIQMPSILAAGQRIVSRVESLKDLLSGDDAYEEFDFVFPGAPVFFAGSGGLLYLGLGDADLVGNRDLLVGNGRTTVPKGWTVDLETNAQRVPESLATLTAAGGSDLAVAWTDLHLQGETNEGDRALRLARLPTAKPNQKEKTLVSFEVPPTTGHSSFSSVQLADASAGRLAVFATVGTQDPATPGRMKQATLIIGFTK